MSGCFNVLALDTATSRATVAVCQGERVLAEDAREVTTHSEGLLTLIHETLAAAELPLSALDAVVCGRGPGSFTGLRIGMATAKGLCFAAGKPLICASSLQPLASLVEESMEDVGSVAAVLDARRKEVFCGLYQRGQTLQPEFLARPGELVEILAQAMGDDPAEPLVLAGDGAVLYQELLLSGLSGRAVLAPDACHQLHARYLARAALPRLAAGDTDDLARAVPLYIRPSDARLPKIPQNNLS